MMRGLDAWITSGWYSKDLLRVRCEKCDEWIPVTSETEYGTSEWTPSECPKCRTEFDADTAWEQDEPPDPEPDDFPGGDPDGPW
jgi:hypothetical protein